MSFSTFIKIVFGAVIACGLVFYTVYKSPLDADKYFYEETFKGESIDVIKPDRYDVEVMDNVTGITVKGEKREMERLKEKEPYLYVQAKAEEGEQELLVNVKGLEALSYEIENERVTAKVTEAEPTKLRGKVVFSEEPKGDIEEVTIKDDIVGVFNDDVKENINDVKVHVDVSELDGEDEKVLKGKVKILDKEGKELDERLLEEKEVDVEIKMKKE